LYFEGNSFSLLKTMLEWLLTTKERWKDQLCQDPLPRNVLNSTPESPQMQDQLYEIILSLITFNLLIIMGCC
jgi:hypothetical protein